MCRTFMELSRQASVAYISDEIILEEVGGAL